MRCRSTDRTNEQGVNAMTEQQKKVILRLRKHGLSYADISNITGISVSTIKAHFYRHKQLDAIRCKLCGKIVPQGDSIREKHFCDSRCYGRWWRSQAERPRTVYKKECAFCGKPFKAVSKKQQKYCSRACFNAARKAG